MGARARAGGSLGPPDTRFLAFGLGLWAAGVQLNEAFASAGALATLVFATVDAARAGAFAQKADLLRRWWPLAAFLGWALLAGPLLAGAAPSGSGAARLLDWAGLPAAAWAASRLTPAQLRKVGAAAAAVLALSCLAAGLQHFGLWPSREAFGPFGWTKLPFDRVYEAAPGEAGRFLAGGLLFHRLRFAHLTSLAAVVALAVALRSGGRTRAVASAAGLLALASVALFPGARAAFVAALAACLVQTLLLAPSRQVALAVAGGVVLAGGLLLVASPSLRARLADSATSAGSGDRAGLVGAGLAAVHAHPLAGVGPGRFKPGDWATETATAQAREHGGKSHNQLVTLAAETGVPGGALFLVLLGWLAAGFWRGTPEARAGLGALALLLALSALHDPLFHAEVSLAFVLALGVARGLQARRFAC